MLPVVKFSTFIRRVLDRATVFFVDQLVFIIAAHGEQARGHRCDSPQDSELQQTLHHAFRYHCLVTYTNSIWAICIYTLYPDCIRVNPTEHTRGVHGKKNLYTPFFTGRVL